MKVQELIDKIAELKEEAKVSQWDSKESLEKRMTRIYKTCDNILIDWKMENAKCLSLMNSSEKH